MSIRGLRRAHLYVGDYSNDSVCRAFGASAEVVAEPITMMSLAGVGKRVILIPEPMKLGGAPTTPLVRTIETNLPYSERVTRWFVVSAVEKLRAASTAAGNSGEPYRPYY
jgi:hypothetical protein